MKFLKVKDIKLVKDDSESNLIKNEEGKVIDFKRSEYVCKIIFQELNNKDSEDYIWISHFPHLAETLRLIAKNEDYKYPNGLGRNMIFNSYLYPIWKDYLLQNNFLSPLRDINFSIQQTKKTDPNIELFLKEVEDDINANKD